MSYNTTTSSIYGSSYSSPSSGILGSSYRRKYLLDSGDSSSSYSSSFESPSRSLYETRRYLSDSFGLRSGPSHDKYGKELSNYERWKLSNGESISGLYVSKDVESEWRKKCNRRVSRALLFGGRDEEEDRESRSYTMGPSSSSRIFPSTSGGFSSGGMESIYSPPRTYARSSGLLTGSSSSSSIRSSLSSFPSEVQEKLSGYTVQDVRGDGGCYYRCLSLFFSGTESNYNNYRREVMSYIRDNLENYSSMIKSEIGYASTSDYFSRKTRLDRQEFAETTEIIATCVVYNINVHVLALVPGRRNTWEWLHFDPSIGSGRPSSAVKHIYLYNQGSVHFQLCTPKF